MEDNRREDNMPNFMCIFIYHDWFDNWRSPHTWDNPKMHTNLCLQSHDNPSPEEDTCQGWMWLCDGFLGVWLAVVSF